MRRFLLIPAGVLASALALGCGDGPGVTDPATSAESPLEAAATKSPAAFPVAVIDQQAGLTAVFGVPLADAAAVCAGADSPELSIVLIASHPSSGGQTIDKVTATSKDQSAIVWPVVAASDQVNDVCDAIQGVQPLAVGTVHSVYTESELFSGDQPHLDSEGFRAEGTVASVATGRQFSLRAGFQLLIAPDGALKAPVEGFVRLR